MRLNRRWILWMFAGVGVAFAAGADEPTKPDVGEQIRDWTAFVLGLFGSILALLAHKESRKAASAAREAAAEAREATASAQKTAVTTQRIEVGQHLAEAWDLMGGKPGTTGITNFSDDHNLELARRLIEKALILDPKSTKAHLHQGVYFYGQGMLDEAIAIFRVAIRLDPKNATNHNNLGRVLREQGKLDEVIAEFRTAIRLDPEYAAAHNNLGITLKEQGKLDEAAKALARARELGWTGRLF